MEASSCVKAVVVAANQYMNNKCDAHLVQLQRQLDVLISVTGKGTVLPYFEPRALLPTKCLSCLVDIMGDPQVKPSLAQKALVLLGNLATEEAVREQLHPVFHLTSSLAAFLRSNMTSPSDPVIIQCLKILQRITYNCRISFKETYLDDLIKVTVKHIQSKEDELTQPCLGLLANLSRHNFSVQSHIKNMENVKAFYKSLINYMSHPNQTMVIFALSILTNLCLHEELGDMLFNAQNIHQTFQLMFNILVNGDSPTTRRYTVDLFKDILHQTCIQQSLARYEHLEKCISQVLQLIGKVQADSAAKIFELLLCFCATNGLRGHVCCRLLDRGEKLAPAEGHQPPGVSSLLPGRDQPFLALIHWATQNVDMNGAAPVLALECLREVYQEVIDQGLVGGLGTSSKLMLPLLTEIVMAMPNGDITKRRCLRTVRALQLLTVMSSEESLQSLVVESVDARMCQQLTEQQLNHNHIALSHSRHDDGSRDHEDWSEVGAQVVLYGLDLMTQLRCVVPNMESVLGQLLADARVVPFLAFALTSDNREMVHVALKLFIMATALPGFSTVVLGESIAASNSNKAHIGERNSEFPAEDHSPTSPQCFAWSLTEDKENLRSMQNGSFKSASRQSELDSSVEQLIDKMQTGMELKDMRASEIINVYEHKLQSFQTKENHLQDLLEAKALALSQADRLISQYRCRRAQSEAEAQKMRSLLRESERKAEEHREQLHEVALERERLQADLEQVCADNTRLEAVATQHVELTQAFQEQTQRLENAQRSLSALKQEHQTMTEMHDMLRRHNETLRQQHDAATEQLAQLEEERKVLTRSVKEKEASEKDLNKSLTKTEESLKKTIKERDELEKAIDKLRLDLTKTEKVKKQLQHQVTSLEVVCQQHEDSIQQKDQTLRAYKLELDKHAQIAALIHNLSSGNAAPPTGPITS